jgi:hypothetical protein
MLAAMAQPSGKTELIPTKFAMMFVCVVGVIIIVLGSITLVASLAAAIVAASTGSMEWGGVLVTIGLGIGLVACGVYFVVGYVHGKRVTNDWVDPAPGWINNLIQAGKFSGGAFLAAIAVYVLFLLFKFGEASDDVEVPVEEP